MKIIHLAAFLSLVLPVAAQDSVKIKMVKIQNTALGGQCVIEVSYPQVPGRADLNSQLRTLVPPAQRSEPGEVVKIEEEFTVRYNAKGLLSVAGEGLMMPTRDGLMTSAHPSKLFGSMTLDLKTGQAYSLRDMFGKDAYRKLDPLVYAAAAKEMQQSEPVRPGGPSQYSCYLTPEGVTFYRLFDNFVAGSVKVTLPYSEVLPLANPGGPLARLKHE